MKKKKISLCEKYSHRYSKLHGQKLNGKFDTAGERISELETRSEKII